MEVVINSEKFEIMPDKIYALIMDDDLIGNEYTLSNQKYYQEESLINAKMNRIFNIKNDDSFTDNKRIHIANLFSVKNPYYIIENLEKNFTNIDIKFFNKFFRNLVLKYHKVIIIKSNDISYLIRVADNFILFNEKKIISKEEFMNNTIYNNSKEKELVDLIRSNGINMRYQANRLDILKDIYKLVK